MMKNMTMIGCLAILASACNSGWTDDQKQKMIDTCKTSYINGLKKGGAQFDEKMVEDKVIEACECVQEKREKEFTTAASYKHNPDQEVKWMDACFDQDHILEGATSHID